MGQKDAGSTSHINQLGGDENLQRLTQATMLSTAHQLEAIRVTLSFLVESLPTPPPGMVEGTEPENLATFLLGTLEHILMEDLGPAIRDLGAAAVASEEELVQRWQENNRATKSPFSGAEK